jgi:hypothetical protein
MADTGPSLIALVLAVPIIAGTWGLLTTGVLFVLTRRLGPQAVWLWPAGVLALVAGLVASREDAFAPGPNAFATLMALVVFTLAWGVAPAAAVRALLRRQPQAPFGRQYARVVVALLASTAALTLLVYLSFRLGPPGS